MRVLDQFLNKMYYTNYIHVPVFLRRPFFFIVCYYIEFAYQKQIKWTGSIIQQHTSLTPLQAVMQSIEGNRKDNFTIVRGVSDYIDGTQRREWQPYASLIAAAYAKTLILQLPVEEQSDSD